MKKKSIFAPSNVISMSYKAIDIARKLIQRAAEDQRKVGGEKLTNLKLQKLLYYMQGYHLAAFGNPLFEDDIESWMYGPVVPIVYDYYSDFGSDILPEDKVDIQLNSAEERLFNIVFMYYRDFSAIGLMNRTHSESPWQEAVPHDRGTKISNDSIHEYFSTQLRWLVLDSLSAKLNEFHRLEDNWDGYGAPPISPEAIKFVKEFITSLPDNMIVYTDVLPTEFGGIDLRIDKANRCLAMDFGTDSLSWYLSENNSLVESDSFVEYSPEYSTSLLSKASSL